MSAEPLSLAREGRDAASFAAELAGAHARAAAAGASRLALEIGDVPVELTLADPILARLVERAMGHLRPASERAPGIHLGFFAGGRLPASPWPIERPGAKGEIGPTAADSAVRAALQPELPALHFYERATARGWAWYGAPERLPSWEHPHLPLRLLHFALADLGWFAVHGAVVERGGRGVLLPGRSGSGKTTTAVAALAAGWRFLGDDHVLVRPGPEPAAASLFATTRLTARSEAMLAAIGLSAPVAAAATPPSDKALFYVAELPGVELARTTPLAAIALPRKGAGFGPAEPASPAEALRELAPSTILFLPHAQATGTFGALGQLVRALPAFHLPLGEDLARVGPALDAVLARCGERAS